MSTMTSYFQRWWRGASLQYLNHFLLSWYKSLRMQLWWNATLSPAISVTHGVWHGGVLSPILFTICMDDLLSGLKDLGIGCYWDGFFVGVACYADDIALLAPSPSTLRMMLHCCEDFAGTRGLIFSASKTQLICFGSQPSTSCSANIHFFDATLWCILVISYVMISLTPTISWAKCGILLGRPTRCYTSFLLLILSLSYILRHIWHLPCNCHTRILHLTAHLPSLFNVIIS